MWCRFKRVRMHYTCPAFVLNVFYSVFVTQCRGLCFIYLFFDLQVTVRPDKVL